MEKRNATFRDKTYQRLADSARTAGDFDSLAVVAQVNHIMEQRKAKRQKWVREHSSAAKQGKPLAKGEFMRWTDTTTPRMASLVENVFGEGIQLHRSYLLQDALSTKRPVIVSYQHWWNYVPEALLVGLFLIGCWCGRRSRFFWMVASFAALDTLLHLGLGFGINEIYIMSAHWIYVVPIAIGYLLVQIRGRSLLLLRTLLVLLTLYLWAWNGSLIVSYMI